MSSSSDDRQYGTNMFNSNNITLGEEDVIDGDKMLKLQGVQNRIEKLSKSTQKNKNISFDQNVIPFRTSVSRNNPREHRPAKSTTFDFQMNRFSFVPSKNELEDDSEIIPKYWPLELEMDRKCHSLRSSNSSDPRARSVDLQGSFKKLGGHPI